LALSARSRAVRTGLYLGIALSILVQRVLAEDMSETLVAYAVNVHRTPRTSWTGYGIYLGSGIFITAAHVAGRTWMTWPKIAIAGVEYPTQVLKEGSFEGTDLTLLSVDEKLLPLRLSMRKNSICKAPPRTGQQVVTVVPEGIAYSHILAPDRLPADVRKFSTVIADVARTGNSGSGVFDLKERCLLGIMSRMITGTMGSAANGIQQRRDIAKYFVPAAEITEFLPAELRSRFQ
jgi:hypothetical protein